MRIAVISDVHSNLLALDAVLARVGAVDAVWHLGDVVGYGPEPDAVVERLASIGAVGVRGNHDAAACGGTEIDGIDFMVAKKILRKFESLNMGFIKDELHKFILYLDKTFGKTNMRICKEYLDRMQKMS
jgi:predicted phosphodiesterase